MSSLPESSLAVLISARIEWRAVVDLLNEHELHKYPFGKWFRTTLRVDGREEEVVFVHGGWGKISAAASAQYVIDHCRPELLVNLGTCGGFEGEIEKGTVVLADRVIVYDIMEAMGDHASHIAHYTTNIDLSWLREPYPHPVRRTLLVSGDRDLRPEDISHLKAAYGAVAGDWESGSIAWVAQRNKTRCLILRGVTDLVGQHGGEVYNGNLKLYVDNARTVLKSLIEHLPSWIKLSYDGPAD